MTQTNSGDGPLEIDAELNGRIALLEAESLDKERIGRALLESEKRYRRLFEAAKDGILILDVETGKVVDVNPFLCELLGYTYEDLNGKHIWELGVFSDIAASKEAFKHLQEKEYIHYDDLPLETRDGRPISVEFVSNVYLVDESKVIQCNIRDITARKHAEAERKRIDGERLRLLAAIEQAGEGIVVADAKGIIQFVNPAFQKITGYTREEAIGKDIRYLRSGEHDVDRFQAVWETVSGGTSWAGRLVNKRRDGTVYTEEITMSPVRDAADGIVSIVAVKRDITDQIHLAEQLGHIQKMESIGLLAGGVAHDFNNMLCVIVGYTEIALNKPDLPDNLREELREILKAANRSAEITRQLLTFARRQAIVPIAVDLNKSVEGMLHMLRQLIGEDIELRWQPKPGHCTVKMDPAQIDQMLANLCANARDAIAGVGRITIETGEVVFDEAFCADNAEYIEGQYALLAISDDGCGMTRETIDKIFDPFFTSKGVGEGTGLGLSMVYGIVEQNLGFIKVFSQPAKGTTFSLYLPRFAGQSATAEEDKAEQIPASGGETVLVVEDEPALLKMVKGMLESVGYRVLAAKLPEEAVQIAGDQGCRIDLLLTDVVMPKMNGRELAEQLQTLCPEMKLLFMSGYSTDVIVQRGVLDETMNFIQKPFSARNLAAKVRETLS